MLSIYYRRVLEDAFLSFFADQINGLTCSWQHLDAQGIS